MLSKLIRLGFRLTDAIAALEMFRNCQTFADMWHVLQAADAPHLRGLLVAVWLAAAALRCALKAARTAARKLISISGKHDP